MRKRHVTRVSRRSGRRTTRSPIEEVPAGNAEREITDWLRDAYAMERGLEQSLQKQSENEDLQPELRKRAAAHLKETRRHALQVQAALKSLGADISVLKTGMGMVAQVTKGLGSAFAEDEHIKDLLDAYSMEHFEIACYTALAAAAERVGIPEVVEMCRRILPDEERMAEALIRSLPSEVSAYVLSKA
jgi:ferritin-like metal-binding protein YciE